MFEYRRGCEPVGGLARNDMFFLIVSKFAFWKGKPGDVPRGIDGSRGIQFTVMLSIFCRVSSGAVR